MILNYHHWSTIFNGAKGILDFLRPYAFNRKEGYENEPTYV